MQPSNDAPRPGCDCIVCQFFNWVIAREAALEADLAANYERYLAGQLVSKDAKR